MARFTPSTSKEFLELQYPPFTPYVLVETTRAMPTSIAMSAVCGAGMKFIDFGPRHDEIR
jgi:hypothetical protein